VGGKLVGWEKHRTTALYSGERVARNKLFQGENEQDEKKSGKLTEKNAPQRVVKECGKKPEGGGRMTQRKKSGREQGDLPRKRVGALKFGKKKAEGKRK